MMNVIGNKMNKLIKFLYPEILIPVVILLSSIYLMAIGSIWAILPFCALIGLLTYIFTNSDE